MDADCYLLAVIACMADHKLESFTFPGCYNEFETGVLIEDTVESQWDAELKKVSETSRTLLQYYADPFCSISKTDADALRMKLFAWLGHNLNAMWD